MVSKADTLPAHREFTSLGEGREHVILLISGMWCLENECGYVTGGGGQGVFEEVTSGPRPEGREASLAI